MSTPQRGGSSEPINKSVLLYATQRKLTEVSQKLLVLRNDVQELERELAVLRRNVPSTVSQVSRPRSVAIATQPVQQGQKRQTRQTAIKKRSVKYALTSSRDRPKQLPRRTPVLPLMARYRTVRKKRRTHIAADAHFNRPQEVVDLTSSRSDTSIPKSVQSTSPTGKSSVGELKPSPASLANNDSKVSPKSRKDIYPLSPQTPKDPPVYSVTNVARKPSPASTTSNDSDRKPNPATDKYKFASLSEDTKPRAKSDTNSQERHHSKRVSTEVLNDEEPEEEDPDSEDYYFKHVLAPTALRDYYRDAQRVKQDLVNKAVQQYGRESTHTGTQPECASTREELRSLYKTLKRRTTQNRLALFSICPTCLVPLPDYLVDPALLNQSVIDLRNPFGDILRVQVPDGHTWKFTGLPKSCVPEEWTILEK